MFGLLFSEDKSRGERGHDKYIGKSGVRIGDAEGLGFGGVGFGGKGVKGKGSNGGGVYGLDLMGIWGGDGDWNDQGWGGEDSSGQYVLKYWDIFDLSRCSTTRPQYL